MALAFQMITCLTRILPENWADWFVERASGFEKEMRGMLVEKTSPGLGALVRLLQKSEDFVFFFTFGMQGTLR